MWILSRLGKIFCELWRKSGNISRTFRARHEIDGVGLLERGLNAGMHM